MPLYDFKCEKCGTIFEKALSISDRNRPLDECCPSCGEEGKMKRYYSGKYTSVVEIENIHGYRNLPSDWKNYLSKMKKSNPNSNVHD
jgi:putative FmdB family regulatory protein